jgi:hypothetical protein
MERSKEIKGTRRIKERYTLWLFNIAMENGPFIDGLLTITYKK